MWDGNFVNLFQINVEVCMNSTSNNTCSTKEKIQNKFQNDKSGGNLFFSDLSLFVQPSLNDYEKPIATTLVNSYQMLNLDITKRKIQTYKITAIDNDVGWFFEDFKYEYVINTNDILTDFSFKDRWTQPVLYNSFQYMRKKVETYRRSYIKIQEVFAAIGGFSKFFYTVLLLIFNKVRRAYNNLILMDYIPFNEDSLKDRKAQFSLDQVDKRIFTNNFISQNVTTKPIVANKPETVPLKSKFTYCDYLCHSVCKKKGKAALAYKKLDNFNKYKAYFLKKLDITSYFDIHHKLSLLKKILLSKDNRFMIKFIKLKLKNVSENVPPNYSGLDQKSILAKSSSNFMKQNSTMNLDCKSKILIEMMEEDVRKNFE
jgi:hypothetical protein